MTTSNKLNIIGLGGLPRSGKDTLAELLMDNGYYGVSLGDIVRYVSRDRHASEPDPISVKNMTETANYLRSAKGPDFAIAEALDRYKQASSDQKYKGLVVFSVRAPVEVDYILNHGGRLIWVDSSNEARHQRTMQNLRQGEVPHSLDEMLAQESLQEQPQPGMPDKVQMNTAYVKQKATTIIENNGNDKLTFISDAKKILGL